MKFWESVKKTHQNLGDYKKEIESERVKQSELYRKLFSDMDFDSKIAQPAAYRERLKKKVKDLRETFYSPYNKPSDSRKKLVEEFEKLENSTFASKEKVAALKKFLQEAPAEKALEEFNRYALSCETGPFQPDDPRGQFNCLCAAEVDKDRRACQNQLKEVSKSISQVLKDVKSKSVTNAVGDLTKKSVQDGVFGARKLVDQTFGNMLDGIRKEAEKSGFDSQCMKLAKTKAGTGIVKSISATDKEEIEKFCEEAKVKIGEYEGQLATLDEGYKNGFKFPLASGQERERAPVYDTANTYLENLLNKSGVKDEIFATLKNIPDFKDKTKDNFFVMNLDGKSSERQTDGKYTAEAQKGEEALNECSNWYQHYGAYYVDTVPTFLARYAMSCKETPFLRQFENNCFEACYEPEGVEGCPECQMANNGSVKQKSKTLGDYLVFQKRMAKEALEKLTHQAIELAGPQSASNVFGINACSEFESDIQGYFQAGLCDKENCPKVIYESKMNPDGEYLKSLRHAVGPAKDPIKDLVSLESDFAYDPEVLDGLSYQYSTADEQDIVQHQGITPQYKEGKVVTVRLGKKRALRAQAHYLNEMNYGFMRLMREGVTPTNFMKQEGHLNHFSRIHKLTNHEQVLKQQYYKHYQRAAKAREAAKDWSLGTTVNAVKEYDKLAKVFLARTAEGTDSVEAGLVGMVRKEHCPKSANLPKEECYKEAFQRFQLLTAIDPHSKVQRMQAQHPELKSRNAAFDSLREKSVLEDPTSALLDPSKPFREAWNVVGSYASLDWDPATNPTFQSMKYRDMPTLQEIFKYDDRVKFDKLEVLQRNKLSDIKKNMENICNAAYPIKNSQEPLNFTFLSKLPGIGDSLLKKYPEKYAQYSCFQKTCNPGIEEDRGWNEAGLSAMYGLGCAGAAVGAGVATVGSGGYAAGVGLGVAAGVCSGVLTYGYYDSQNIKEKATLAEAMVNLCKGYEDQEGAEQICGPDAIENVLKSIGKLDDASEEAMLNVIAELSFLPIEFVSVQGIIKGSAAAIKAAKRANKLDEFLPLLKSIIRTEEAAKAAEAAKLPENLRKIALKRRQDYVNTLAKKMSKYGYGDALSESDLAELTQEMGQMIDNRLKDGLRNLAEYDAASGGAKGIDALTESQDTQLKLLLESYDIKRTPKLDELLETALKMDNGKIDDVIRILDSMLDPDSTDELGSAIYLFDVLTRDNPRLSQKARQVLSRYVDESNGMPKRKASLEKLYRNCGLCVGGVCPI